MRTMPGWPGTWPVGCALLASLLWTPAHAQPSAERVIAITESVGYEIDPAERERYRLFTDYRGFHMAEIVHSDEQYWLRISYQRDGERMVEQIALGDAELQELRHRIASYDAAIRHDARLAPPTDMESEGRLRLVTDAFLYGTLLYGPGIIVIFDLEGAEGGVELVAAGGSFAWALKATGDYRLGYGRTRLVRWGNFAGTFYGLGLPALFEADSDKAYAASAMAMTPVGGYLMYRLSAHRRFAKGNADLITTGMAVGGLYGIAATRLIDVSDMSGSDEARVYVAAAMAGVPTGAFVANRLVRDRTIDRGRAHLVMLGAWMGAGYALGLVDLVDDGDHVRPYLLSAMVGLPAGAYLGYRFTGTEEYTLGRGRMISVGAYAGALAGNGLMLTIWTSGTDSVPDGAFTVSAILGSALGVWYTHRYTRDWGEHVTRASAPAPDAVRVSLPTPATLATLAMFARHGSGSSHIPPFELVRITF